MSNDEDKDENLLYVWDTELKPRPRGPGEVRGDPAAELTTPNVRQAEHLGVRSSPWTGQGKHQIIRIILSLKLSQRYRTLRSRRIMPTKNVVLTWSLPTHSRGEVNLFLGPLYSLLCLQHSSAPSLFFSNDLHEVLLDGGGNTCLENKSPEKLHIPYPVTKATKWKEREKVTFNATII